ncbi:MAG: heterodisulfide reductase-related iron-sulfur binding cluster [Promethearchaeota archaeon]
MDIIFYPGCLITYRFPFIEKMTRLAMVKFEINLIDVPEFTCCPDPQGVLSNDKHLWLLAAARNLALAEKLNLDIFTICNGCYSTFRKTLHILNEDLELKNEINLELDKINLEFKGNLKIKHIHEIILRDIGLKKLQEKIVNPLGNLKVAVHYGCHAIRPSNIVEFDDAGRPTSLETIITALGAKVADYEDSLSCCGGALNYTSDIESYRVIQKKILNKVKANADCIAVICPSCFLQFEVGQLKMQKNNIFVKIPVFHLGELLANALGIETSENILKMHKVRADLHERKLKLKEIEQNMSKYFRMDLLKNCAKCRACSQDCSLVKYMDYDPLEFVDLLLEGKLEETISNSKIWSCLNCYNCLEKCPQRMGLADLIMKLRNLATKFGYGQEAVSAETQKFLDHGVTTGKLKSGRKRLGLSVNGMEGIEELKEIINEKNMLDVET